MEDGGAARERRKGIARRNEEGSQRKDEEKEKTTDRQHPIASHINVLVSSVSQSGPTPKVTAESGSTSHPPARSCTAYGRPVCPPTRMCLTRAHTLATPYPERTLADPHFSAPEVTFLLQRTRARRPARAWPRPTRRSLARLISQKGNKPLTSSRNARGL
jgi:hypothetical protein